MVSGCTHGIRHASMFVRWLLVKVKGEPYGSPFSSVGFSKAQDRYAIASNSKMYAEKISFIFNFVCDAPSSWLFVKPNLYSLVI